jgi:release factor glutamine methyltransferase
MPFCELELEVGPGVLIPRGETEVLVDQVARAAAEIGGDAPAPDRRGGDGAPAGTKENGARPARGRPAPLLVDVGTGSGAILLALLQRLPGWIGIGTDRSLSALAWARRNRARIGRSPASARGPASAAVPAPETERSERAFLVRGELCAGIRRGSAAVVVSNPPYIRSGELAELAPEIRNHEPHEALDGGEDGLDVVRLLVPEAAAALRPGGILALELAPDQPEVVREWIVARAEFQRATVFQDLAGRPRGVLARKR